MSTNKPVYLESSKPLLLALASDKIPTFTNPELFDKNLAGVVLSYVRKYDYDKMKANFMHLRYELKEFHMFKMFESTNAQRVANGLAPLSEEQLISITASIIIEKRNK